MLIEQILIQRYNGRLYGLASCDYGIVDLPVCVANSKCNCLMGKGSKGLGHENKGLILRVLVINAQHNITQGAQRTLPMATRMVKMKATTTAPQDTSLKILRYDSILLLYKVIRSCLKISQLKTE